MSQTTPNAPMLLDSTGQAIVGALDDIKTAIENGGGGGGGSTPAWLEPDDYDSSVARYGSTLAYVFGDYCKESGKVYRCNVASVAKDEAFNSSSWYEIPNVFTELSAKPGMRYYTALNGGGFAERYNNMTSNSTTVNAHAEGSATTASGAASHAEGTSTTASLESAHAEGSHTVANGNASHAEGSYTEATSTGAHSEGSSTKATGSYSHAEGSGTKATVSYAHAEGYNSEANGGSGSHAEGNGAKANGDSSHAEGYNTKAVGQQAHAEGYGTEANGMYSHSEGYYTKTGNNCAHSGGNYSEARSKWSFAHGNYAYANNDCEAAFGAYNATSTEGSSSAAEYDTTARYLVGNYVIYSNKIYKCIQNTPFRAGEFDPSYWQEIGDPDPNYVVFSVGNGSYSARSNAFEVRKDGTCKAGNQQIIAIDPPTTDGTYTLQCTVLNGIPTFTWV